MYSVAKTLNNTYLLSSINTLQAQIALTNFPLLIGTKPLIQLPLKGLYGHNMSFIHGLIGWR